MRSQNWFWVVIGVVFVGMHLFGHGGHGGVEQPFSLGGTPPRSNNIEELDP